MRPLELLMTELSALLPDPRLFFPTLENEKMRIEDWEFRLQISASSFQRQIALYSPRQSAILFLLPSSSPLSKIFLLFKESDLHCLVDF